MFLISVNGTNYETYGCEAAYHAYKVACDFAELFTGDSVALLDGETGEVLEDNQLRIQNEEPEDIDSDVGFDPYMGEFTFDC